MPFSSQQKKSPRKQTRLKERESVCASVAFVSAQQQQQLLLKNAKKKSLLTFRVYNPNTRNGHSLLNKNFSRESARAKTASLPPHANTKTMSFSLQCSTSTQSSRVSTSSLTSNATSKRVVQRKAFRVRAADAGTC